MTDTETTAGDTGRRKAKMHDWQTIGYRARNAQQVARILDKYRVTGAARVAALRSFHNDDRATVAIPAGRLVINRKS
jgi:hypothetical protein